MNPNRSQLANYAGPDWPDQPRGYALQHPLPDILAQRVSPDSDDEWAVLLHALNQARAGRFEYLARVPALLEASNDFQVISAGLRLIGDAASAETLRYLEIPLEHEDPDIRIATYKAIVNSADLDLARAMVRSAARLQHGMELDILADAVSQMLETDGQSLMEPRDIPQFQRTAYSICDGLEHRYGTGVAIMFGKPLSPQGLLERALNLLNQEDPEIYHPLVTNYLLKIEALTGFTIDQCFDEDEAIDVEQVESLALRVRAMSDAGKLVAGQRYFFGHLVP